MIITAVIISAVCADIAVKLNEVAISIVTDFTICSICLIKIQVVVIRIDSILKSNLLISYITLLSSEFNVIILF